MSKIEKAVQQMEAWAGDDSHGYDQTYRWGQHGDFDCSAAVIQACENAGIPVKSKGATYTGNMLAVFKKCGFVDVTSKVNRLTGAGLLRGGALLNTSHHTAMYCGNGKEVEASINEKGTATGGKPGDQTGKEFLIKKLPQRSMGPTSSDTLQNPRLPDPERKIVTLTVAKEVLAGAWGNGDDRKNRLTGCRLRLRSSAGRGQSSRKRSLDSKKEHDGNRKRSPRRQVGESATIARRSSRQQDITMQQCRRKSIAWPKAEAPQRKA